ncbi:non-canonical purine NTP pyrophosphatase [Streptomyces sp. NBC_01077]|uniref:non-canonical purine NTP pyrophosphatase n=1 Tax=Streptomyces sp. NBC_01077 TaxID=2903746 RepID=UPI00386D4899
MTDHGILFATTSPDKFLLAKAEMSGTQFTLTRSPLPIPEIQSVDPLHVAVYKAKQAHASLGRPVIVVDSGLDVPALMGFPGALLKPLLERAGACSLVRMANGSEDRSCALVDCLVYVTGRQKVRAFVSRTEGRICRMVPVDMARGPSSDIRTIFIPDGYDQTISNLPPSDYSRFIKSWTEASAYRKFADWVRRFPGVVRSDIRRSSKNRPFDAPPGFDGAWKWPSG